MAESEERFEDSIGKTLGIYRELAIALNSFPKGKTLLIKDLAEKAQVHYNTAKKALIFFHQVDSVIPKFQIQEGAFKVTSKPSALEAVEGLFESREMRVLTKMMLVDAICAEKAQKLDDLLTKEERDVLPALIERGYVNSIEGMYYLSSRGQSLGSMGLNRIAKLDIPLPWENRADTAHETQISRTTFDFQRRAHMHAFQKSFQLVLPSSARNRRFNIQTSSYKRCKEEKILMQYCRGRRLVYATQ